MEFKLINRSGTITQSHCLIPSSDNFLCCQIPFCNPLLKELTLTSYIPLADFYRAMSVLLIELYMYSLLLLATLYAWAQPIKPFCKI